MNTTNAAVGAGVLVTVGRWSEGDTLSVRVVVGVVFLAIILSILPPKVANPFAALVLVAVAFRYLPGVIAKTGLDATPKAKR